jgi:hypothetical protein
MQLSQPLRGQRAQAPRPTSHPVFSPSCASWRGHKYEHFRGVSLLLTNKRRDFLSQPGDDSPRVGEVHFASGDFLPPSAPPSQVYCIVNELSRLDEDGCFSFVGAFPFTVLAAASVVPVEVMKAAAR